MNEQLQRNLCFTSPEQTTRFATRLSSQLKVGDVLLLQGDLGAGKTHFARGVIQAWLNRANLSEDVPSPTFTLVQTYNNGQDEIWHADLYRLTDVDEVYELGLMDAFDSAICLVEWPDRLADETPNGALTLHFAMTNQPGERLLKISSSDNRWAQVVDAADD